MGWGDVEGEVVIEALRYAAQHCVITAPVDVNMLRNPFSEDMIAKLKGLNDEFERHPDRGHVGNKRIRVSNR